MASKRGNPTDKTKPAAPGVAPSMNVAAPPDALTPPAPKRKPISTLNTHAPSKAYTSRRDTV